MIPIFDISYCILQDLLFFEDLPTVLLSIGTGILTIFVALAIFLVDKNGDFEIDRRVIFDKVFQIKYQVFYVSLLFLPLIIWGVLPLFSRFIVLIVFILSLLKISYALYRSYLWISAIESNEHIHSENYRTKMRIEYMESLGNLTDRRIEWEYVWKRGRTLTNVEKTYFVNKFLQNLSQLIDNNTQEDLDSAAAYLSDFEKYFEQIINYDWNLYESFWKSVLKHYVNSVQERGTKGLRYFRLENVLNDTIKLLVQNMITYGTDYLFFKVLEDNLVQNKEAVIVKEVVEAVAPSLFEMNVENEFKVWDSFPREWKVTNANLEGNNKQIVYSWLNEYINWAQRRIWNSEGERFDKKLESVTYGLLPEVDPPTWSYIFTFIAGAFTQENRIQEFVHRGTKFGIGSRPIVTSGEHTQEQLNNIINETIKAQENATYKLALKIFGHYLQKDKLEKYELEADSLKLKTDSHEYMINEHLKYIFKGLKEQLD